MRSAHINVRRFFDARQNALFCDKRRRKAHLFQIVSDGSRQIFDSTFQWVRGVVLPTIFQVFASLVLAKAGGFE